MCKKYIINIYIYIDSYKNTYYIYNNKVYALKDVLILLHCK